MTSPALSAASAAAPPQARAGRPVRAAGSGVHALHDGYVDLLLVLLPVWKVELGLSLAQVGFLRTA